MEKTIESVLELFDLKVRRLRNGNKLSLTFESAEDLELEKKLIEFRGKNVKANITQENIEDEKNPTVIDATFEVFDLKCRRLRNGDKLMLTLERMYGCDIELSAVKLRYKNCKIKMTILEDELDFEQQERESIENEDDEDYQG